VSKVPGLEIQVHPRGLLIPVRASAGARQNGILGARNGAVRIKVTAAPEKGRANTAIIALLSKAIGIPKSAIELVAGQTAPQKRFLLICEHPDALYPSLNNIVRDTNEEETE